MSIWLKNKIGRFVTFGIVSFIVLFAKQFDERQSFHIDQLQILSSADDGTLCAMPNSLESSEFIQPAQLSLPLVVRHSPQRPFSFGKHFCGTDIISKRLSLIQLNHTDIIQKLRRSYLHRVGYYIYQLRKIII